MLHFIVWVLRKGSLTIVAYMQLSLTQLKCLQRIANPDQQGTSFDLEYTRQTGTHADGPGKTVRRIGHARYEGC